MPTALAVWADWVKVADRWATDSGGGRRLPCAEAGRRVRKRTDATTRTVWQQSVPRQTQAGRRVVAGRQPSDAGEPRQGRRT